VPFGGLVFSMSVAPLIAVACCVVGCLGGAASGFRHSFHLAAAGAVLGLGLGIVSFLVPVFPYVWCLVRFENSHRLWVLWQRLALPLLAATLILAALSSWFVVGVLP
jgi:hypothetical protein